jgi:hypothetical protein
MLFMLLTITVPRAALGFTHVVRKGETLAAIAERFYGKIQHEKLLVAANSLDAQGGSPIVAGMRLEIPALGHYTVSRGDTWPTLADRLLGAPYRADVLAKANGSTPWLPTEEGAQIVIPYNLTVIVSEADTIVNLAYKYLGNTDHAWTLTHYNQLKKTEIRRGDVLLVPLTELALTDEGKRAAAAAASSTGGEAKGRTRAEQQRVEVELPALLADIRQGRYVEAVRRGNRFLASGSLTKRQLSVVHRQLLEAYAALEAPGLAASACSSWRKLDPEAKLDPVMISPKILAACRRAVAPAPAAPRKQTPQTRANQ